MKPTRYLASLAVSLLFAAPCLRAQERVAGVILEPPPRTERPDAYGTTALTLIQVAGSRCVGYADTTASVSADGWVQVTGGPGYFDCPFSIPAGAKPVKVEVMAHDASDAGKVSAFFTYCPVQPPGYQCYGYGIASTTGTAAAPFDGKISTDVTPYNATIDKTANLYSARVLMNAIGAELQFRNVDVYYRLQVSSPPGTPTFADVPPSNTYFKAIEALAASGITGGCGGGNFCPGAYVTRGEVATFFARALGLHFPN